MNVPNIALHEFENQRRKRIALYPDYQEYERRKREIYKKNISQTQKDYEIRNLIDDLGV